MLRKLTSAVLMAAAALVSQNAAAANALYANQSLGYNENITSANGKYMLVQQSDGNLVLYRGTPVAANARWASYKTGVRTYMQQDGNFVQYNAANVAVWNSETGGHPASANYAVVLKDDGSLVVGEQSGVLINPWSKVIVGPDNQAPTTPTGPCPGGRTYQTYQVCIPTGGGRGMFGTIQACSQSEAATQASRNGWTFGACTF
ncbi:hypothetical protein [Burkholderia sp. LMU1-1-1.1]|uniref:hypothetical protein n=1 Tax=Burkholderia sp. LMU1-1-1.1 TaxID=3135266 RepID=UPI003444CB93